MSILEKIKKYADNLEKIKKYADNLEKIKKYADDVHNLNLYAVCNKEKDASGEVKAVLLSDIEKVLEEDWKVCELCGLSVKCQIRKLFDLKYCSQFERK